MQVELGAAATRWGAWRTLRSEHRVTVEAKDASGKMETRALRGLVAVERPGRFRLRALGPGGITLFDVLYVDGEVKVIESLRDPRGSVLGELLRSIGGDLAVAYGLAPRAAEAALVREGDELVARGTGRVVRLSAFREVPGGVAPSRMRIENDERGYRVSIEAAGTTLDEALDPSLFQP